MRRALKCMSNAIRPRLSPGNSTAARVGPGWERSWPRQPRSLEPRRRGRLGSCFAHRNAWNSYAIRQGGLGNPRDIWTFSRSTWGSGALPRALWAPRGEEGP